MLDAVDRAHAFERAVVERGQHRAGRVAGLRRRQARREEVGGIEPRFSRPQLVEAAGQQGGADEQGEGERGLHTDERRAGGLAAGSDGRAARHAQVAGACRRQRGDQRAHGRAGDREE